jgi:hypothetical protein
MAALKNFPKKTIKKFLVCSGRISEFVLNITGGGLDLRPEM